VIPSTRFSLLAAAALVLAPSSVSAQTNVALGASMDAGEQVAAVASTASGNALVTLDTMSGAVALTGSFAGLTSNVTVAHIHGPAARGQNAGVVLALTPTGTTSGTLTGNGILSAQQMSDLLAGLTYVNVHTTNFGGGEIRGQIDLVPSVDCAAELITDPVLTDVAGAPFLGPNINDPVECFGATLDCSGAGAPGIYAIQIRQSKLGSPAATSLGHLWVGGQKFVGFAGAHTQNTVMAGPLVLPNDVGLVGISYGLQGFCGGRLSNALQEQIGLP
jgi:hypothetical protein